MPKSEFEAPGGFDPLQKASVESMPFNAYLLKNGASLTMAQRVGYALQGLVYFGAGLLFLTSELGSIRQDLSENGFAFSVDLLGSLLFGVVAACLLILGCLALKNVLTFSTRP